MKTRPGFGPDNTTDVRTALSIRTTEIRLILKLWHFCECDSIAAGELIPGGRDAADPALVFAIRSLLTEKRTGCAERWNDLPLQR
jgi:hypothetical protein